MKTILILSIFVSSIYVSSNGSLDCQPDRFSWMNSSITVGEPWSSYSNVDQQCCDSVNPQTFIDFDVECSMCYGRTLSIPGFMKNPNNCQEFFMCVPKPEGGGYTAYNMSCPDCMFWDDVQLSCVEVDTSCRVVEDVVTGTPNTEFENVPLRGCIDFEDKTLLTTGGLYVENNGVDVVTNGVEVPMDFCPQGNNCGYFNASKLEVPFFANNYNYLPNLKITFDVYHIGKINFYDSIFVNECYEDDDFSQGSLFFGLWENVAKSQLVDVNGVETSQYTLYKLQEWTKVTYDFNGTALITTIGDQVTTDELGADYPGIKNSHCPLTIGSLIKEIGFTYFGGYIDNMCFYIDY